MIELCNEYISATGDHGVLTKNRMELEELVEAEQSEELDWNGSEQEDDILKD